MTQKSTLLVIILFCLASSVFPKNKNERKNVSIDGSATSNTLQDSMPSFETDKNGIRKLFNFSLKPKPISDPVLLLSHFANRNLLIFYFSVKCIHCQRVLPHVKKLAVELESSDVTVITIAVKNNTEADIRSFIREYSFTLPVFHDFNKSFSSLYGTGEIPLLIAITKEGEFLRFKHFKSGKTSGQIKTFFGSIQ